MMNPDFTETQKFNKWWHYLIAGVPVIFVTILFLLVQVDIMATKNNQKEPLLFIGIIILTIGTFIWFIFLKLKTIINSKGVYSQFLGIPFCKKTINWEDIKSISVLQYSPLTDYGGWGVRYSLTGNGWCYNVSGNYGIKIIQTNGKPFLIGTQQKEEAEKIINHYFKKQ
jgi:hypothetical protein